MNDWPGRWVLLALAAALCFSVPAGSQTTRPAASTTTAPAAIAQPAELTQLALKARKLKSLYIKGKVLITSSPVQKLPPHLREAAFEIWARPPLVKTSLEIPSKQVRLCDGRYVYTFWGRLGQQPLGRRRRVKPGNFYDAVDLGAVAVDAANGYANLAASVRFVPTAPPAKHAATHPELKWFRLEPVVSPPHHLLRKTSEVVLGISPADGMVRVMVGRGKAKGGVVPTTTVLFEKVVPRKLKPEELKLPPAAAEVQWFDGDTRRSISVPQAVIAARKD